MTFQPLTLTQLFGKNASQDDQYLIIQKADLPKLTATSNNRGEQLLVAILLKAFEEFYGELIDHNGKKVTDIDGNPITYDFNDVYEFLEMLPWDAYVDYRDNQRYIFNTIIFNYRSYAN